MNSDHCVHEFGNFTSLKHSHACPNPPLAHIAVCCCAQQPTARATPTAPMRPTGSGRSASTQSQPGWSSAAVISQLPAPAPGTPGCAPPVACEPPSVHLALAQRGLRFSCCAWRAQRACCRYTVGPGGICTRQSSRLGRPRRGTAGRTHVPACTPLDSSTRISINTKGIMALPPLA